MKRRRMLHNILGQVTAACMIVGSIGCTTMSNNTERSNSRESEAMDIDQNKEVSPEANVKSPAITGHPTAESALKWQHYFKGTPTSKERPRLQQTLTSLASAVSIPELMTRGRNEAALGMLAAAESTFRQVLRKDSKQIDALIELAGTLQRQRKTALALDVLAEAKACLTALERPDVSAILRYRYTLAMTYLSSDDRKTAHKILSDLIGRDRTFLPGYAALAFSYLKEGKDQVAKFIVDQALDRSGDHPALYNILGILYEKQGQISVAKDQYNRALSLNDSYAPALVNRGNLYVMNHELSMAESDYKRGLESDPSNVDAMIGLGAVYRQTGRYKAARDLCEKVIILDRDNPQARFNLAVLLRENMNDSGLALRYFNEVTQSERANPNLKTLANAAIDEIRRL